MNSFSFFLSGKLFICPQILNDSFAGQSNLGRRSLLFMTLNIIANPFQPAVSFENSALSLMETPMQVTNFYFLKFLKIFKEDFIHLFLERGNGKEKERERSINVWFPLMCPTLGTWSITQACAPRLGIKLATLWFAGWCSIH